MRYDGREVNAKNIAELKEGYSCIIEKRENYHEVFKYVTKGLVKYEQAENACFGNREDFRAADYALYNRRVMQSYGCLRCIPDTDKVDESADNDEEYKKFIAELERLESPIEQLELLSTLAKEAEERGDLFFISCKNIRAIDNG